MIKVKARVAGGEVVIIGLSHANLDRLRADGLDGYIRIDGKEMGLNRDIWITAGPTEAVIMDLFSTNIGPETVVHIDKRFKQ